MQFIIQKLRTVKASIFSQPSVFMFDMREQIRLKMTQDKKNTKPASNNQSVSKPTPVTQAANDATRGFQTTTAPTIATAPKEKKEKAKKSSLSALEAKLTEIPNK